MVRRMRRLTVNIPAGVDQGTEILIRNEGEPGQRSGPHGHLYIVLSVRPHQYFRRKGVDLILNLKVNVAQAALGTALTIPVLTPNGETEEELRIPPGAQSGDVIVLKKKGAPHLRRDGTHGASGDLHVVVEVVIPSKLTAEQRALFEKLGSSLGEAIIPPAQEKGFLEKMIDWLGGE
jgi:molecular chaperone DnaJ